MLSGPLSLSLSDSLRTATSTIDPLFLVGLELKLVSPAELLAVSGVYPMRLVFYRTGSTILIDREVFQEISPRLRADVVRMAVGQKIWAESQSIQSAFGRMFVTDAGLLRLGTISMEAFARAFAKLNGPLGARITLVRYYPNVDAFIRSVTGLTLLPQEKVFLEFLKTGPVLGAEIRYAANQSVILYGEILKPSKEMMATISDFVKASRTSMVRTFNNRLAVYLDRLIKDMVLRGEIDISTLRQAASEFVQTEYVAEKLTAEHFEAAWVRTRATEDYVRAKDLVGKVKYVVYPEHTAICSDCLDLIAGSPYTTMPFPRPPFHKNCVHYVLAERV